MRREMPWMIGLSVRSESGRCSSSSSRVRARTAIWARRACTGSSSRPMSIDPTTRRMPRNTRPARTTGSIWLDLDVHDLLDREEADDHHHAAHAEQDLPEQLREERSHEVGVDHVQDDRDADRKERDEVARHPALSRQRADLALDANALADGERDGVEDLGEVPTDLLLDADRGDHEIEVLALDPAHEVVERLLHAKTEVHLTDDAAHLLAHRRGRLARHELDGLQEAR